MAMLLVADMVVRSIVAVPMASPAPMVTGSRCPSPPVDYRTSLLGDVKHGSVLGGCAPRPPSERKTSHEETLGFDDGSGGYDDEGAE